MYPYNDLDEAQALHARASINWSEVFLCEVIRPAPEVLPDEPAWAALEALVASTGPIISSQVDRMAQVIEAALRRLPRSTP